MNKLQVGQWLSERWCHDYYGPAQVEAIGPDWVVLRTRGWGHDNKWIPVIRLGDPQDLVEYAVTLDYVSVKEDNND